VNLFALKISEIVGNMKFEIGQVGGGGVKIFLDKKQGERVFLFF